MRRWALFGFESYYPQGGWDDLHGLYERREDAETVAQEQWNSHNHWQLVDLKAGEVVWMKSSYDMNPCRGREHEWGGWMSVAPTAFLVTPSNVRECARCKTRQSDGAYLGTGIFPALSQFTNAIPRVSTRAEQEKISGG